MLRPSFLFDPIVARSMQASFCPCSVAGTARAPGAKHRHPSGRPGRSRCRPSHASRAAFGYGWSNAAVSKTSGPSVTHNP